MWVLSNASVWLMGAGQQGVDVGVEWVRVGGDLVEQGEHFVEVAWAASVGVSIVGNPAQLGQGLVDPPAGEATTAPPGSGGIAMTLTALTGGHRWVGASGT
jgi:hypothetical protein